MVCVGSRGRVAYPARSGRRWRCAAPPNPHARRGLCRTCSRLRSLSPVCAAAACVRSTRGARPATPSRPRPRRGPCGPRCACEPGRGTRQSRAPPTPESRLLPGTRDTTPHRAENVTESPANWGEAPVNPGTTPSSGLCPLNPGSALRGDNALSETRRACGWRCGPRHARLGIGPMTIQGPTLHSGLHVLHL